ncbi:uncharacterized protein LOC135831058 [Sycon ciliatum]|uniref:uncharacterized protein LOC135831058 n=1 Tax=Sycon ciliatum TaxID=27933 RepID=UPI0020AE038E|eukprot:scpid31312/ scgid35074/ 
MAVCHHEYSLQQHPEQCNGGRPTNGAIRAGDYSALSQTDGACSVSSHGEMYDSGSDEPRSSSVSNTHSRHPLCQVGDPVSPASFGMASQGLRAANYNSSFCLASAAAFIFPPCLWLSAVWSRMDIYTMKFTFGFRLAMMAWPMIFFAALLTRSASEQVDGSASAGKASQQQSPAAPESVIHLAEVLFPAYYYVLVSIVFIMFYGLRNADSPLARRRRPLSIWRVHGSTPVSSDDPNLVEATCVTWRPDDWDTFRKHVLPPPDQCPIVLKRIVCVVPNSKELTYQAGSSKQHEISEYRERVRSHFVNMWMRKALLIGLLQSLVFPLHRWWTGVPCFGYYWSETCAIWLTIISSYILVSYFWFIALESYSVLCMQYDCVRNFTYLSGETCEQSIFDFSVPADVSRWLRLRALLYEYNHARLKRITGKLSIIVVATAGMAGVPLYEVFFSQRTVVDVALVHLIVDLGLFGLYIVTIFVLSLEQQSYFVQHAALLSMRKLELSLSSVSEQRACALEQSRQLIDEVVVLLQKFQRFPRLVGIPISRRYLVLVICVLGYSMFSLFRLLTESNPTK